MRSAPRLGVNIDHVATVRNARGGVLPDPVRAALIAIEAGADGVVVSNHGARNLDGATPSITALPAIAAEIGRHGTILLDSGIRHGADIARALALGADAVLLGRAVLFGLAAYGEAGAARASHLLRHEFETAMALLGAMTPAEITRDLVMG